MKGSLVNRNGHYSVVVEDKDQITGKRKQRWIKVGDDYKEATRRMTRIVNDQHNGVFVKPTKTTLAEYLEQWLTDCVRGKLSPRTLELYTYILHTSWCAGTRLKKSPPSRFQPTAELTLCSSTSLLGVCLRVF